MILTDKSYLQLRNDERIGFRKAVEALSRPDASSASDVGPDFAPEASRPTTEVISLKAPLYENRDNDRQDAGRYYFVFTLRCGL